MVITTSQFEVFFRSILTIANLKLYWFAQLHRHCHYQQQQHSLFLQIAAVQKANFFLFFDCQQKLLQLNGRHPCLIDH